MKKGLLLIVWFNHFQILGQKIINFLIFFFENWWHQKLILQLTYLQVAPFQCRAQPQVRPELLWSYLSRYGAHRSNNFSFKLPFINLGLVLLKLTVEPLQCSVFFALKPQYPLFHHTLLAKKCWSSAIKSTQHGQSLFEVLF